jgi:hypothetical protein
MSIWFPETFIQWIVSIICIRSQVAIVKWLYSKFAHHLSVILCEVIPGLPHLIICWRIVFLSASVSS